MSDDDPLKSLWTDQKEESFGMSEADIGARAQKLDATIRWRDAREYAAAAIVVALFGYTAATDANPVVQIGAIAVVLAAIFVSWKIWSMAAASKNADLSMPWFDRYRGQLVRQRDALKSVWLWYSLPFVPGVLAMIAARHIYPIFKLNEPSAWAMLAWPLAFVTAVFAGVIWLNRTAARKLQSQIEELDRAKER